MSQVEWPGEETSAACIERSFLLRRLPRPVPGMLWSPETTAPHATVLLFHGGSGHKRSERHLRMGRWLASTAGLAVIAIDGPYHGDRAAAPMPPSVYQRLITGEGIECVTARMTEDWLDAVFVLAVLELAMMRTSASSACTEHAVVIRTYVERWPRKDRRRRRC